MAKAANNQMSSSLREEATKQRKKHTKPGTKANLAVGIPPGFEVDFLKVQQLEIQRQQDQNVVVELIEACTQLVGQLQPDKYPLFLCRYPQLPRCCLLGTADGESYDQPEAGD